MRIGLITTGLLMAYGLSACQQAPDLTPAPSRVTPGVVAAGQERYVVIEGKNFLPTLTWNANQAGTSLDTGFSVRFGTIEALEVSLASTERLVAKIPADLPAGRHPVTVRSPGGQEATLPEALCADDQPLQELLHGLVQNQVMNLCASVTIAGEAATLVEDFVPGVYEGTGMNQVTSLWQGYNLSPDGLQVGFLRYDQSNLSLSLWLADLTDHWEAKLAEVLVPANDPNPNSYLSPPAFSLDGRVLVYTSQHNQLIRQAAPEDPGSVPDPQVIVTESQDTLLLHPEIDPAGRFVLYTRVQTMNPDEPANPRVSLHLIPFGGGEPRSLLPEEEQSIKNGPGTFMPAGDRVLFISDRLNIDVPTPFGTMAPATNFYTVPVTGGPAEPVSEPKAAYLFGKPVVSPDGRMAAVTGFLSDTSGSGADLLVADLETGAFGRLWSDPTPFCFPQNVAQGCDHNQVLRCCAGPDDTQGCCGFQTPEYCPTWDLGPVFGPDSRSIYANGLSVQWACLQDEHSLDWYWGARILNVFIFRIDFKPTAEAIQILDGDAYPFHLLQLPLAPQFRQAVTCR